MLTRAMLLFGTAGCLLYLASGAADAQGLDTTLDAGVPASPSSEPTEQPDERWTFTIGAGAAIKPDYEGSEDYEFAVVPSAKVQRGDLYGELLGLKLTTSLVPHPNWRLGPVLNYRAKRDDVEDNAVDAMQNVDAAFEFGASGGYDMPMADGILGLRLEFLHDLSNAHDGWLLTPSVRYRRPLGQQMRLSLATSASFASEDYMETYFDVSAADSASSGLKVFNADAGFKDLALSGGLSYEFLPRWSVSGLGQWKLLLGDAADSPVTDDRGSVVQFIAAVIVSYTW